MAPKKEVKDTLRKIAQQLRMGEEPSAVSVRDLLSWFGAQRRDSSIVEEIRHALATAKLETQPDFEGAFLDSSVTLVLKQPQKKHDPDREQDHSPPQPPLDPTYRIEKLAAANRRPVSVRPDHTVQRAVTLMLIHDFSQLPVMTSDREVKGVISWSSLGKRLALGQACEYVRECMEPHHEISADTSLFAAIDEIVQHQYVLIRNAEKVISGIVTTSDLSLQFKNMGEPFLLIGEIENYIRRMLQGKFTREEFAAASDPGDNHRKVESVSHLTVGEYRWLLEKPENWAKLALSIDRGEFRDKLEAVRGIRNNVMHFDPDGIPETDVKVLRDFVKFLQGLADIGAI